MVELNIEYIDEIKQELVNVVAQSPHIVPEIFSQVTSMPTPTVKVEYPEEKMELRRQRRKKISQIWNYDYPPVQEVRKFQEQELLLFLNEFPQYKMVIL